MANTTKYFLNDPSYPELLESVEIGPPTSPLKFQIPGYDMVGGEPFSNQFHMASCYTTLTTCINFIQGVISKFQNPPSKWAAVNSLTANPMAGRCLNAYYDRMSLKYFFEQDPVTRQMVYTADSADVVAHESGHALLDALRPDLWNAGSLETWAFHESFGDVMAILTAMQHDEILTKALNDTNGNLLQSNILSKIAEYVGITLFHMNKGNDGRQHDAIRDAVNSFNYVNPATLPAKGPINELVAESHSFGRVFIGAWYEAMVKAYQLETPGIAGLKTVRDVMAYYLLKSTIQAPHTPTFLNAVGHGMVSLAKSENSKYADVIQNVFLSRNIIQPQVQAFSNRKISDLKLGDHEKFDKGIRVKKFRTVRLSEHFTFTLQKANNPFLTAEIEVPADSYYELDQNGNIVNELTSDNDAAIASALACVEAISAENLTISGRHMWGLDEKKLVRNFIE